MPDLPDGFVRLRPGPAPVAEATITIGGDVAESVHVRLGHCSWSSTWRWYPGPSSLFRAFRFRCLVRRAIRVLPGVQSVAVNRHNVIVVNVEATSFKSNRAIAEVIHAAMVAVGGWVNHCLIVGEDEHEAR